MISKENVSAARPNRAFSHLVRYRTYLTPPSNPFREGKSKLQIFREVLLVLFIVSLVMMVVVRFFQDTDASADQVQVQKNTGGSFETVQSQMQKLRGEMQEAKEKRHHDASHRHHDEEPMHENPLDMGVVGQQDGEADANEGAIEEANLAESIVNATPENKVELRTDKMAGDGAQHAEIKEDSNEGGSDTAETQDKPPPEEVELKES